MSDHPADLDTIGQTDPVTVACDCGSTHTIKAKRIRSTANPALATSVVGLDDFRAQRAWIAEHRAHGGNIHQPAA
ncbi:hypothetical protein ACFYY5_29190 [Nocardia elegans]|uniref:Uncharacterized protein n=1 Tax=Nocardia elegans TaxID=300029 RepID=A0ABW6TM97_9NOCA